MPRPLSGTTPAHPGATVARLASVPYHPYLFAIYPVLALLAANAGKVDLPQVVRPLLLSVGLAWTTYALLVRVVREARTAGLMTTVFLLLFFSYGHVYHLARDLTIGGVLLGRHRYTGPIWIVLLALGWAWVWRRAPHDPFVFGPQGEPLVRNTPFTLNGDVEYVEWPSYAEGYRDELTYLNQRLLDIVRRILAVSTVEPIIVLQGDHGIPRLLEPWEKLAILNALYLPKPAPTVPETLTPVNTFRLIQQAYLDLPREILPDRSYDLADQVLWRFVEVEDKSPACGPASSQEEPHDSSRVLAPPTRFVSETPP